MILSLLLCIGASACMMRTYDDAQMAMLNATNLYIGDQETDLPVKITTVDNVMYSVLSFQLILSAGP